MLKHNVPNEQPPFIDALKSSGLHPLRATGLEVLQLNLGKRCNRSCRHCHVDAGPTRSEVMPRATMRACLDVLRQTDIPTVDLTGGSPEMNPHFRWLVGELARLKRHIIVRTNLTILLARGYEDLPMMLARHGVEIAASLPCYLAENVDRQRGNRAFEQAIEALRRLNAIGYGHGESRLKLTLVHNPLGPSLPASQASLEADYRGKLHTGYGVVFNRLLAIANMPLGRFLHQLEADGQRGAYMDKLVAAYNPVAARGVMCRTTLSVDWRGQLYDCDFNQMLDMPLTREMPQTISDFDFPRLTTRPIATAEHCYGCTAGAGSGCQGAVVDQNNQAAVGR